MSNVIAFKKPKASLKHQGKFLCRQGIHQWQVDSVQKFSVKQGKLLTVYRCKRCGSSKHKAL